MRASPHISRSTSCWPTALHRRSLLLRRHRNCCGTAFIAGGAIPRPIPPLLAETASPKWRAAFKAALLAYFDRGGMQVQVNALSAQQMREAMADANAHPDLAVRIGGFSMHFRHLSPQAQEDMAVRVEQGV